MKNSFPGFRLFMILAGIVLAGFLIIIRLVFVQIINHRIYEAKAQEQWFEKKVLYAKRGRIFDRNGNPLAVTCQMYDLGITPKHCPSSAAAYLSEVTGLPLSRISKALRKKNSSYVPLRRKLNLEDEDLIKLSALPGVTLDPVQERIFPFDAVDRSFIGMVNDSGAGVGGVESAFDNVLSGKNGWIVSSRDALNRSVKLIGAPRKNARDGADICLTIDSDIQRIADFEIRRAVDEFKACGGVVIVADPENGDILALAEHFPGTENHILYSSGCFYEPGSTFKLISYSYMLQKKIVDIEERFDGENGQKVFDFGVFRDDHPHGVLTVKQSFVYSSNICTIKAMMRGDCEDFYRFLLRCGFGCRTGIEFPVETGGVLREPDRWTDRSLPSIAIGQEVGVTPLQLLSAYAAIANGGELYVPRVVMAVEKDGEKIRELPPVKTRRILPRGVCEQLREFCREVVLEGTGRRAGTDLIEVAGKTGTAQKAGVNGYSDNKYISSFVGFAPVDNPRIACLVLLDEPAGLDYYGGVSSAPVFRRVVEGICLSSDGINESDELALAEERKEGRMVRVPVLLRMGLSEACRKGAESGVIVNGCGGDGLIYSQNPGPGELVRRGAQVDVLMIGGDSGREKLKLPDFRGLTIREARRELIKYGLRVDIEGYGTVRRQNPRAGSTVRPGSVVKLYCRGNYELTCPAGTEGGRS